MSIKYEPMRTDLLGALVIELQQVLELTKLYKVLSKEGMRRLGTRTYLQRQVAFVEEFPSNC
jgi:hypothetical protein